MSTSLFGARYLVLRTIGQGGMATVYLGLDVKHDRKVAIKVMDDRFSRAVSASRFQREISVTARLDHPSLLTLIDSGEADGKFYYVMPFVDGPSLRDILETKGRLPVSEAIRITREIASALEHVHQHGVVHRDVKPGNVLFRGDHPLLSDFGVALPMDSATDDRLTEGGLCLGTPAYMSPEQFIFQRSLDGRSDVYSLACVLFEMLTGAPPFTGPSIKALAACHLYERLPSLRARRPDASAALQAHVERALAKQPADRFRSAAAFGEALQGKMHRSWSGSRLGRLCQAPLNAMHGVLSLPVVDYFETAGIDASPLAASTLRRRQAGPPNSC
jgi:serine/threonine protein kinase